MTYGRIVRGTGITHWCIEVQGKKENRRMSETSDLKQREACGGEPYKYDFAQAERILKALDFLRSEAVERNVEEIVTMIDANFRLLTTTYYSIIRYEMTKLAGNEMVQ
jgi:hypothetical protein